MSINVVAKDVINNFSIKNFVETGIYKCGTQRLVRSFFEELGVDDYKMWGVDIHEPYINDAKAMFGHDARMNFVLSESSLFLESFVMERRTLFYLDAHVWHANNNKPYPIIDEVRNISRMGGKPIIMIDDFQVPFDQSQNWTYGDSCGSVLNLNLIKESIIDKTDTIYYTLCGEPESNQGQCVIFINERNADISERISGIGIRGVSIW